MKRVIGFDPGLAIVGYGIIDYDGFNNKKVVDYGVINTPKHESFPTRLAMIYKGVTELIEKYHPQACTAASKITPLAWATLIPVVMLVLKNNSSTAICSGL